MNYKLSLFKRFRNSRIEGRRYAYGFKDGAAFSSPLKSQVSRFLIPNKTH